MNARSSILCSLALLWAGCASPQHPPAPGNVAEEAPPAAAAPVEVAAPAEPPLPEIPDSPAPAPASLIAVAGVADPSATLASLGVFLDAASPGASAMASTELIDGAVAELFGVDLAGVDYTRPMWAIVLDPMHADVPVVVVVTVSDRAAFDAAMKQGGALAVHHRGLAAIGSRRGLEEAAPHALSSVALGTAPALPTATLHVAAVMDRYGPQLEAILPMLSAQFGSAGTSASALQGVLDGIVSLLRQTEQITLSVDPAADLTLVLELTPRSGAPMAELFARQPVASFDAMAHYAGSGILVGGKLDWDSLREHLKPLTAAALTESWGDSAGEMQELWAEVYRMMTGEMAFAMHFSADGGTWMAGLWGVSDPKKARTATAAVAKLATKKRPKDDPGLFTVKARTFKHKGVRVTGTLMTPKATAPEETRAGLVAAFGDPPLASLFGVVDRMLVMTMGEGAERRMKASIDRLKAKKAPAPSASLAQSIALARDRKESLLTLLDLAGALKGTSGAEPIAIGLGFADGRLRLRLTVPADQVRQLTQLQATTP